MNHYLLYAILIYLAVINIVAFCIYGIDKWKARRSKWRVTEARLIAVALLGGSLGAWLGMKIWHHKTMHAKFRFGLPFILILHLAIAVAVVYYFNSQSSILPSFERSGLSTFDFRLFSLPFREGPGLGLSIL